MMPENLKEAYHNWCFKLDQDFEAKTGLRVLNAYKCIKCGQVFDDFCDAAEHIRMVHNQ